MVFLIGVAGASGTGKTRFAELVKAMLVHVNHFSLDDYHKYGREERKKLGITPLNPKANDFKLMYEHITAVKQGEKIVKPIYDHSRGVIIPEAETFVPENIVIIEGLLPFYDKKIARLFDLKIFFDVSERVRLKWKLERDKKERGYKRQFDLKQRRIDYNRYVLPQKKLCDVVVEVNKSKKHPKTLVSKIMFKKCPKFTTSFAIPLKKGSILLSDCSIIFDGTFHKSNIIPHAETKEKEINSFTASQIVLIKYIEDLIKRGGFCENPSSS
jgi:uridine kinase